MAAARQLVTTSTGFTYSFGPWQSPHVDGVSLMSFQVNGFRWEVCERKAYEVHKNALRAPEGHVGVYRVMDRGVEMFFVIRDRAPIAGTGEHEFTIVTSSPTPKDLLIEVCKAENPSVLLALLPFLNTLSPVVRVQPANTQPGMVNSDATLQGVARE